jgi:phosphonate transport system substrate-binding protein
MVSARTGLCFHLLIPKTIPEFEALFLKGEPDIAFLNPYHQVMAHDAQGYVPMLADSKPLTGIIVVRRDSTVQGIKDLNRQTIAFPAPNAFAASLLLRAILTESKIDFRAQYVQTHSNVYRAVAAGTLAAGGGVNNTLAREPQALRDELRVLYESPGFRSHPLSAHPRVPPKVRQEFSNAIFQLALFDQGKNLLNQVQLPDPSAATHRDDYAPLERLGVQRFVVSDN